MDALTLLKKDHDAVKQLFRELDELGQRAVMAREKIAQKIAEELRLHSEVEEQIVYPAIKEKTKGGSDERVEVLESYEEHALVANLLDELGGTDPKDESYRAKLRVIETLVLQHVKEEEGRLFRLARDVLDHRELAQLGEEIAAAKQRGRVPSHA
ncbi:hemerythrin domain-containing protein [bacterium]|nr:MAG: hemerythrin domain-containing protein [bacterium]